MILTSSHCNALTHTCERNNIWQNSCASQILTKRNFGFSEMPPEVVHQPIPRMVSVWECIVDENLSIGWPAKSAYVERKVLFFLFLSFDTDLSILFIYIYRKFCRINLKLMHSQTSENKKSVKNNDKIDCCWFLCSCVCILHLCDTHINCSMPCGASSSLSTFRFSSGLAWFQFYIEYTGKKWQRVCN